MVSERLTDELRRYAYTDNRSPARALMLDAANKLDAHDALLNGGPCPTCGGRGSTPSIQRQPDGSWLHDACPDCIDGRTPGVIERLERLHRVLPHRIAPASAYAEAELADLAAVIALLRKVGDA